MGTLNRASRNTRQGPSYRAASPGRIPDGRLILARPPAAADGRSPFAVSDRDVVFRHALLVADLVAGAIVAALDAQLFGGGGPGLAALVLLAVIPVVNTAAGLYKRDELLINKSTLDEAPRVFQAATLTTVVGYLAESAVLALPIGARLMATTWLALTVVTLVSRMAARAIARRLTAPERCLVVGERVIADRLGAKLTTTHHLKAVVVGRLALEPEPRDARESSLGTLLDLRDVVRAHRVDRVIVAGESTGNDRVLEAITSAKAAGVKVSVLPRMFEAVGSTVAFDYVEGLTLLGVRRFGLSRASRRVKRTFDLVGSVASLVVFGPLMAAIALAIRLGSRGPVIFRQIRVGRHGEPFEMLKFRSMDHGAEGRKAELQALNEAEGLFKIARDPRITAVGRILRRTSLDELPQLVNVVRGEMSLVGPRPLIVEEDRRIQGWHRRRLDLTPGMTGHWQVLGYARIPLREMVTIDYLYIANWSLWSDVKILLRTVGCVVERRGR